jgi:thioredoxin reductase (NADPH)
MDKYDVTVIGQGYAGLTAARLAIKRGLRTANVEGQMMGGLIINVNELDPVPEGAGHAGAELASNIALQNMDDGVVTISDTVTAIERRADGLWVVHSGSETHAARHVIVASGARLRKLGVPGEAEFFGQGVSECADCDGPMFAGMATVIVGGGDSAFQEALALSQYASKVTMIMRGAKPRARAELVERVAVNPKLVQLFNTRLVAIEGVAGQGVSAVRLETTGRGATTLATGGVFVFIGVEPATGFLPAELERDASGALITSTRCATALAKLWAIGAVRSGFGGLLTHAAADAERVVAHLS